MFDFFRKKGKFFTFLLMLLVVPSFIFGGIELYRRSVGSSNAVATVDGQNITPQEWEHAHNLWMQQMRNSTPGIDESLLNSPAMRYRTLQQLVDEYLLAAAARKYHFSVSNQQVAKALMQIPQVAALRGADGQIDMKAYNELLRQNGRTPEEFESMIRAQLTQQQIMQGVSAAAGWQPAILTEQAIKPMLEQREIQVALFSTSDYTAQVKWTQADLKTWYQQNAALRYAVPEQAAIEYVALDEAAILKRHPHTGKDVQEWFDKHSALYGQPETRRASHILILADEKADAATHAAAKQKAEELLKEIQAKPERFAELAKQHSQDPGSAAKGGDLGFFSRETMVKPFADTVFATLKKGELSPVVKTQYGYHIIRLDDVKPGSVPALASVREKVENDFRQDYVRQHFSQDAQLLAEESAKDRSSLKGVADKLGLNVQTAQGLRRNPTEPGQDLLHNSKLLQAVFASSALTNKQVGDPVNVDTNAVVLFRVTDHQPEHVQAMDAVKDQLIQDYVQSKAAELAKAAGQAQLQKWKQNPAAATFVTPPVMVSRVNSQQQPIAVLDAALRADPAKLPALEGADLGLQGYGIVRVDKTVAADAQMAAAMQAQYAPAVQQGVAQALVQAYLDALRKTLKVTINVPAPALPGADA